MFLFKNHFQFYTIGKENNKLFLTGLFKNEMKIQDFDIPVQLNDRGFKQTFYLD